jgi:hypothetical protein
MGNTPELYREVKADLAAVSGPLFDLARKHVSDRDAFLPFGAVLGQNGKIALIAGAVERETASSAEILPLVHAGLRHAAKPGGAKALGVCEWVKITPPDGTQTDAIKVLVEHAKGCAFRFYVPCRKRLLGGWEFGPMMALGAEPEINAWGAENGGR